ncbi:response regulator [Bacteroidota bacterium]
MKLKILPIREWIPFLTGKETDFSIEHRLFNVVAYFAGLVGLMTLGINFFIHSPIILTIFSALSILVCWVVFYISRFRNKFVLGKWILSLYLFASFGYVYYLNNGSQGPMLLLYLVFFLLILFVWNGKARLFFIALFLINILAFFLIELYHPDLIKPYEQEKTRIMDVYLSFFLYIILGGVILMFAKNAYISEKMKAEKSDKLKTAFLANMSHEIRTPMNAILGYTQLLQNDIPYEKKDAYVKVIHENSNSLLRLIEDIIDVSKIEAGELKIEETEVDINSLLLNLGKTYRQTLKNYPDKKVEIIELLPTENTNIIVDAIRLNQVLLNLVSNAVKYTEKGSITIGYVNEGDFLRFFVRDTGSGIQDIYLAEIFDRFRKIETDESFKIQPGTGIGLSISRSLIKLMGGHIGVESEFGKGSEFYFTLPYVPSGKVSSRIKEAKAVVGLGSIDLSGKLILVAEDERTNFTFLKKVLERTGAEVIHAQDGEQAVALFQQNGNIDLILMDIMMPVMDGYKATQSIKAIDPRIPIIAHTALAMEGDEKKVLSSGCDDYISKPIRINELMEKILQYIGEAKV